MSRTAMRRSTRSSNGSSSVMQRGAVTPLTRTATGPRTSTSKIGRVSCTRYNPDDTEDALPSVGLCQLDRLAYNSSMQHATDQSNRFTFYHPLKPPLELSPIWVLPPHRAQESRSTGEATGGTLSMVVHTKPARASQRPLTTTTKLCQPILPLPQHRQERLQLDGVPDPDINIIDNHTTHVTLTRSLTPPSHARDQQLCTTLYYGQHTIVTTPLCTIIHPISQQGSAHNTCRTASES
jgi:hypothetical protein